MIISSGEDAPRGQSLQARILQVRVPKGAVDLTLLTQAQANAANGVYATAISGYISWLAMRYDELKNALPRRFDELRAEARDELQFAHDRTPEIAASLFLGFEQFIAFARAIDAVTDAKSKELLSVGWADLVNVSNHQRFHLMGQDPIARFVELLGACVRSRAAHIAGIKDGGRPDVTYLAALGWEKSGGDSEMSWRPQGKSIGYVSGDDLYLDPQASFAEVKSLAYRQQEPLSMSQQTLFGHLKDRGYLAQPRRGPQYRPKDHRGQGHARSASGCRTDIPGWGSRCSGIQRESQCVIDGEDRFYARHGVDGGNHRRQCDGLLTYP